MARAALRAAMLEPQGPLIDDLANAMQAEDETESGIDGTPRLGKVRTILRVPFGWAIGVDHDRPGTCARFRHVSDETLDPRLGERVEEDSLARELPLDIARPAAGFRETQKAMPAATPLAPALIARRAQFAATHPLAEIRDTLVHARMLPLDRLRCKLAHVGTTRFDPRSDRRVRTGLFRGAPCPGDHAGLEGREQRLG